VTLHGRSLVRRVGFVKTHRVTCPHGHPIRERSKIREDGEIWCSHHDGPGTAECGALVYVIVQQSPAGTRRWWAADVERGEVEAWNKAGMSADDILTHFGQDFPRSGAA
jgi:hypothetical protein